MPITPRIPLTAYTDRLSARPGETVGLKISSSGSDPVTVRLARSISADPNPDQGGVREEDLGPVGSVPSRVQTFSPGSWAEVPDGPALSGRTVLEATIWPTRPGAGRMTVLAVANVTLGLNDEGAVALWQDGAEITCGAPLAERRWVHIRAEIADSLATVTVTPCGPGRQAAPTRETGAFPSIESTGGPVSIAAAPGPTGPHQHFDGKIEAPRIMSDAGFAAWDFARQTPTTEIVDTGPGGHHGVLHNLPARAMTGATWDGSEMCWRYAPGHYGAIHFHSDDIYDFGWEDDLRWTVPDDLPSGIYVLNLACGEARDAVPVFVPPSLGARTARACVLISTFTYTVYGNHARPDFAPEWLDDFAAIDAYPHNPAVYREFGLSTYNFHADGSGICHASARRPLFNLRPGYVTFGYGPGSRLRHFQADSHLISWLTDRGTPFDIVTDAELHAEGMDAIAGYDVVLTGSHPEYHTAPMLDALEAYRDGGGRLMYLGGNGFYWRVALHEAKPGVIEIRRAEGGIRAWAAEPGEYFHAFDGQYGGLWRRNGRPPQRLAGVGFSAQGQFEGSHYRRRDVPDTVSWVFDGVQGETFGGFGFSGGGAAGFELDRADMRLGTPDGVTILASSEGHGESFVLVPEEQLTHITTVTGHAPADLLRADMILADLPDGGAVFSTGSITWCGSLPWNAFDNDVSRITGNVLDQFLADGHQ